MALRRLDLRGLHRQPQGAASDALRARRRVQDRSSDAVRHPRRGAGRRRRRPPATDPSSSTASCVDELRVPDEEIQAALRRIPADLQEALDVAHDRILAYHAHEAGDRQTEDFESDGIRVRHLVRPVARAGCYAPGRPGPLPVDRADVRRSGPGGRRRGDRPVRAARAGRADRRRLAGRGGGGRGRRGLSGGRGPGHRGHGLRHRVDRGGRRHRRSGQPLRGRGQAPGVGDGRGGLGLRRPVRGGGDRRPRARRPSWPPSTWSSRPSTGPTAWPG